MRIGVVFNPRSGRRRGDKLHRLIKASITGSGHIPVFLDVAAETPLEDELRSMLGAVDAVAVIGGDGTLNGVVNAVLTSDRPGTPIAFFPAGRGKDASRTIPSFPASSIGKDPIDWTDSRRVDVGMVQAANGAERYFINASDIGLSAAAASFATKLPRQIGSIAYVLGAVYGFIATRPATATMKLDGDLSIELNNLLTIAVCNGRSFGGGIYIAPEASADDGLFDIVAVRNANVLDLVLNLPKLKRGTLLHHPALTRWRSRSLVIDGTSLGPVDLDGEIWGAAPLTYSLLPSVLNWIGPRS
jgi:diacylglycerol kinase (ATP)